jgi:hypothetical protein
VKKVNVRDRPLAGDRDVLPTSLHSLQVIAIAFADGREIRLWGIDIRADYTVRRTSAESSLRSLRCP